MARQGLAPLLVQLKLVDECFEIKKGDKDSYRKVQAKLNQSQIDLVFCPHQSYRTAWFVRGLKVQGQKIGFRWFGSALFFDLNVVYDRRWPDALRQMLLLKEANADFHQVWSASHLGLSIENVQDTSGIVDFRKAPMPDWASMQVLQRSSQPIQKQVILVPGSVWATKRWTEEGFIELAQRYVDRGEAVILLGSADERELCQRIQSRVPQVQNKAGELSLIESLELMRVSQLVVSNDSGAMHLASVAGTPTLAIFGPTTLALGYRPWSSQAVVMQKPLKCRPCGKHGHQKCPIGTHECMKSISAREVFKTSTDML